MATDASLQFLNVAPSAATAFAGFSTTFACWFLQHYPVPTIAQRLAWPVLQRGENLLLAAPTGTGKTLAAFAAILDQLTQRGNDKPGVRCLYVAPMRALIADVHNNLQHYLQGMARQGIAILPAVDVRCGDTSQHVRRRQFEQPPDILATTPESLALLLANPRSVDLLKTLRWVVIDEVHALPVNKRGADLAISLERLERLAQQPLQRIGLSATCQPLAEVASYLVGVGRDCHIARVPDDSPLDLTVAPLPCRDVRPASFITKILEHLEVFLGEPGTTLVFTNTRGLAERLTWLLRRRHPTLRDVIAVHHSSLAQQRRRNVEADLKQGKLRVVISSTSLELGIDIGSVDNVVLVHPPGDIARLLQRVGRSGHGPGKLRRGLILTASAHELLQATVMASFGRLGQVEPLSTIEHPLDVLCQQLLGMACGGRWHEDEAWQLVRRAHPYRQLKRSDFDAVFAYLLGKDQHGRDWLPARLAQTAGLWSIVNERSARLVRRNLGTILTDEARTIRLLETGEPGEENSTLLGEVDDHFAEGLQPGDRFLLEGRCLELRRQKRESMLVAEVVGGPRVPRWPGSGWALSPELARRLFHFRIEAGELLREGRDCLADYLRADCGLREDAVAALCDMFIQQENVSEIPATNVVLIETLAADAGLIACIHTHLPRPANEALARIACQRLQARKMDGTCDVYIELAGELGLVLTFPSGGELSASEWRYLWDPRHFDEDLDAAVEASSILRERFGAVAQTGLMVLRNPIGGPRKVGGRDWAERRLFDQIRDHDADFFLLRQARREVLREVCDAASARSWAQELGQRDLRVRPLTQISPFAECWLQGWRGTVVS